MKTVCTVYKTYKEWEEEGRKDVLELIVKNEEEINTSDDFWYECTISDWAYKLQELGFDVIEEEYKTKKVYNKDLSQWEDRRYLATSYQIAFRGFCSQGDGASFTGWVEPSKWIEKNSPVKYARIKKLIDSGAIDVYKFKITRTGRYVHEKSTDIQYEWNNLWSRNHPNIETLIYELEADMTEQMVDLSKQIYSDLENEYEYLQSEEAIVNMIQQNDYEYDEFGNKG